MHGETVKFIATLVYNDTEYPFHDVITEFDCIFQIVTFSSWP
jgi:hypothetical protein